MTSIPGPVLVAGATGSLGGRIAAALLDRGERVRALARPTSAADALAAAGAEVIRGDLKDPASLARACAGARAVVSTASMSKRNDDTIDNVDLRGNQNLIDAAKAAGVEHVVFVSTVGATADSPMPLFRAKAAAEGHLKASGLAWTVLQPDAFMDVWFAAVIEAPMRNGQPVTLVGESRRRHSFVAERDVAAFAVAALTNPAARSATLVIGGPEAVTLPDVVRAYETAAGRPIPIRHVAPGEPIAGLPDAVTGLLAGLETFDSIIPMDDVARRFGVALTDVSAHARSRVAGTTA